MLSDKIITFPIIVVLTRMYAESDLRPMYILLVPIRLTHHIFIKWYHDMSKTRMLLVASSREVTIGRDKSGQVRLRLESG
jgi:hypothetical protein